MIAENGMLFAALVLLITYFFIATDKISKVTTVMVGASATLLMGLISQHDVFNAIEFNVIFLLISMMIIVHIAGRSGVITWAAVELIKSTGGSPKKAFFALAAFTAFASAFLDNVTTVILIMPVTFVIAREFKISPVPFLITEIIASNIGGTATLIGDPPNIIIGSKAGLTFMDFVTVLTPVITVIFFVSTFILMYMFKDRLVTTAETSVKIANLDNSKMITDRTLMWRSLIVLFIVIVSFIMQSITGIEPYVSAMAGASFLLIFESPKEIIHDVEWMTIFFFIGLFIIIGGLEATGGIEFVANKLIIATNGDGQLASNIILWASGFLSGILDNIPYTVTIVPMISALGKTMDVAPLWWSLSLGACLGGNFTIIGAAANVIVSETSNAAGHKISFMEYLKYGSVTTIISLIISNIYLYFRFFAG